MKKAAIAALFALASVAAHADNIADYVHAELGAGVAQYRGSNGTWYQEGMPGNQTRFSVPAISLGVGFDLYQRESWGVMAHIAYVNLARASAACNCTSDDNYNLQTHSARVADGPMAYFTGSGNAQGISLTIEPYLKYQHWHIGLAAGLFPYRPQWDENVRAYQADGSSASSFLTPHTSNALQWGQSIGVNVQRGNFGASFTYYRLPTRYNNTYYPAAYRSADVLMLTYHY